MPDDLAYARIVCVAIECRQAFANLPGLRSSTDRAKRARKVDRIISFKPNSMVMSLGVSTSSPDKVSV